jgi:hypothetical protein
VVEVSGFARRSLRVHCSVRTYWGAVGCGEYVCALSKPVMDKFVCLYSLESEAEKPA